MGRKGQKKGANGAKLTFRISDIHMYIVQKLVAEEYRKNQTIPSAVTTGVSNIKEETEVSTPTEGKGTQGEINVSDKHKEKMFSFLKWSGEITPLKWMNFYTKVLSRFMNGAGLKLKVDIEVKPEEGITQHKVEQTKIALRELGLNEDIEIKK